MAEEGGFLITQEQKRAQGRERTDRCRARLKDGIRFRFQVPITAKRISDWMARGALGPDAFVNEAAVRWYVEKIIRHGNAGSMLPAGRPFEAAPAAEHGRSPSERKKLSRARRRDGTRMMWVDISEDQIDEWVRVGDLGEADGEEQAVVKSFVEWLLYRIDLVEGNSPPRPDYDRAAAAATFLAELTARLKGRRFEDFPPEPILASAEFEEINPDRPSLSECEPDGPMPRHLAAQRRIFTIDDLRGVEPCMQRFIPGCLMGFEPTSYASSLPTLEGISESR